jgi:hypothetical protein
MDITYQEYMLGKSKSGVATSPTEKKHGGDDNNYNDRKKRGYRPILRALQGRLEEWKATNQKLEGVLRSIGNLRDRVYWESGFLNVPSGSSDERVMCKQQQKEQKEHRPSWRDSGFRSSLSSHTLLKDDIHLALNHDLLQHERMLSALRSLVASLAQTVDEIGRRLDEWMLQNLMEKNDEFVILVKEQDTLELAQEIYSLLASDLYWKQKMATRVFDSCHDGILAEGDESTTHSFWMSDPRDVIKKTSKESSKSVHRNLILQLVNKLLIIH